MEKKKISPIGAIAWTIMLCLHILSFWRDLGFLPDTIEEITAQQVYMLIFRGGMLVLCVVLLVFGWAKLIKQIINEKKE